MFSRRFLLIALAFATALLISSEIAVARELASSDHASVVEDAMHDYDYDNHDHDKHDHDEYDHDEHDHDEHDHEKHDHDKDDHYKHDHDKDDHDYHDHDKDDHDYHDHDDHGYDHGGCNGGHHGPFNRWGHRGGFCKYGCCGGGGYYSKGCRCCSTLVEATAYKQAQKAQTHN